MKTYSKRIGFLVSYQTLVPHGGIGQFTKSFVELMTDHGIKVDIITDKQPPKNDFITELENVGANIIYPADSLPYTTHSGIFMYGDSFCYERMANFRNSIIKALTINVYDSFICNTYETVQVASTMGLEDCIQMVAYTHLESQIFKDTKNPFLHSVNAMMRQQLETDNLCIGTQSKFNQLELETKLTSNSAWHLPIPLTEKTLLLEHTGPREGVLFIGRWEEGKNPELYLALIEQTKLPARIMTNANGAKKFEDRLKKMGATYQIKISIIGQEKVDFISGSRIAFNPSTVESYGMAFHEQIIQLPTFALANQRWTQNFAGNLFFETTKKSMAEDVKATYDMFATAADWYGHGSLNHARLAEAAVFHKWNEAFGKFDGKKSASSAAKICDESTTTVSSFVEALGRGVICIDDIRSVLTNKHKFRVIYTDTDTYLTKDPSYEPEAAGAGLFEFI